MAGRTRSHGPSPPTRVVACLVVVRRRLGRETSVCACASAHCRKVAKAGPTSAQAVSAGGSPRIGLATDALRPVAFSRTAKVAISQAVAVLRGPVATRTCPSRMVVVSPVTAAVTAMRRPSCCQVASRTLAASGKHPTNEATANSGSRPDRLRLKEASARMLTRGEAVGKGASQGLLGS